MDIARINQGIFAITLELMNLGEIVRKVVNTFDTRQIPIRVDLPTEVVFAADPERMEQAVEHLFTYVTS